MALAVAAMLASAAAAAQPPPAAPVVDLFGTTLRATLPDGTVRQGAELAGAVLIVKFGGQTLRVRIAAVEVDPDDSRGETLLYDFRLMTPGGEEPLCMADPDGRRLGLPLAGRSDAAGMLSPGDKGDFELVCTSGAQGKCVRFGYAPWRQSADGRPLRDWYNACIRMLRADYCGDGRPHTRDGTLIDIYDRIGVQKSDGGADLRFEAAWGRDGAICVARSRIPELIDLDGLAQTCPRLKGRLGPQACSDKEGLIFNRSR